jgi:hypothetical protein
MKNKTTKPQITRIFMEIYSVFLRALRASVVKIKIKINHLVKV